MTARVLRIEVAVIDVVVRAVRVGSIDERARANGRVGIVDIDIGSIAGSADTDRRGICRVHDRRIGTGQIGRFDAETRRTQ